MHIRQLCRWAQAITVTGALTLWPAWLSAAPGIALQLVAGSIPNLVDIQYADAGGRLFLVDQSGRIRIWNGTTVLATPFLDISSLVAFGGEQGLLGLAFHPNYAANGLFYVHYTNTSGNTAIARYQVSADPNVANPASAAVLLNVAQPFTNHKGGQIRFGADGFLYIALGDGGSQGDPSNFGQRLDTLLGKILRIDVDSASPYAIPPGNPFVMTGGARGEIWALGLRNPWRFSFDRESHDLFVADVGQGSWEEVSLQAAGSAGGLNFGWRLMEGNHCFNPSPGCSPTGLTLPIQEYSHTFGCSITGGFRYRGTSVPALIGKYVYSDYCTGTIWAAAPDSQGVWRAIRLLDTSHNVATFGEDAAGELYVGHIGAPGAFYRIVAGSDVPALTVIKGGTGNGTVTSSPTLLECGSICAALVAAGTTITLTATAAPGSTFAGWSGSGCADGVVQVNADSSCTAIFGPAFTDEPITAGVTTIRAVHISELRARVDAARIRAGLAAYAWTDEPLSPMVTLARAQHVIELRAALHDAYVALKRTPPSYQDASLAAGHAIRAVHVLQLRQAVQAVE